MSNKALEEANYKIAAAWSREVSLKARVRELEGLLGEIGKMASGYADSEPALDWIAHKTLPFNPDARMVA